MADIKKRLVGKAKTATTPTSQLKTSSTKVRTLAKDTKIHKIAVDSGAKAYSQYEVGTGKAKNKSKNTWGIDEPSYKYTAKQIGDWEKGYVKAGGVPNGKMKKEVKSIDPMKLPPVKVKTTTIKTVKTPTTKSITMTKRSTATKPTNKKGKAK